MLAACWKHGWRTTGCQLKSLRCHGHEADRIGQLLRRPDVARDIKDD